MKFNYDGNSEKSGIYEIYNRLKDRYYIGQTLRQFTDRWREHKSSLLKDSKSRGETNIWLKNDFKKCLKDQANDDFLEFKIIEIVDLSGCLNEKEKLARTNPREIFWVAEYKKQGKGVYNLTEGGSLGGCWLGRHHTEAAKRKMSQSKKGRIFSKEHLQKLREHLLKENKSRTGRKFKTRIGFISPLKGRKLTEEHKRNSKAAQIILRGIDHGSSKLIENIELVSPEGIIYTRIECLAEFCREHKLNRQGIQSVLDGKHKGYKDGWRLSSTSASEIKTISKETSRKLSEAVKRIWEERKKTK